MAAATAQEVQALDRILLRLGLTEEDKLTGVLDKLLPLVIQQLQSPHDAVRKKVLEILSHINKRIKDRPTVKLPLRELAEKALSSLSPPLVRNFGIVYAEMAFERAEPAERLAVVPQLLVGISTRQQQHQEILLRMVVQAFETLASSASKSSRLNAAASADKWEAFWSSTADRRLALAFFQKVLLYQLPVVAAARNPPGQAGLAGLFGVQPGLPANAGGPQVGIAATATASAPSAAGGAASPPTPPGLCKADVAAVDGKRAPTEQSLTLRKQGVLNFLESAPSAEDELVVHFTAAACDPRDAVSRVGEDLLKKRCGLDSPKPQVDLEASQLVGQLFRLFLGSPQEATALPPASRVLPAGPILQSKVLGIMCKSKAAADSFPQTLQVLEASLERTQPLRLRQAGMQFAVWVFQQAADEQLLPRAPAILARLLILLQEDAGSDHASMMLRGFAYQAIGQLAARAAQPFQANPGIAARMFAALGTEPPGIRASLQEAVSSMALAYQGCSGDAAHHIELLLLDSIASSLDAARLCAAQWAVRLFPFSHAPARYIACLACGDSKLEIRETGAAGLRLQKPAKQLHSSGISKATGTDGQALPQLADLTAFVCSRHPQLRGPAQQNEALALPAKAYVALVQFLSRCQDRETGSGALSAEALDAYLGLLEHALVVEGTAELHVAALRAVLAVAEQHSPQLQAAYRSRLAWLQGFLGHIDSTARLMAGKLLGIVAQALDREQAEGLLAQLQAAATPAEGAARRFEQQQGSLWALGYILAQVQTGRPAIAPETLAGSASQLALALKLPNHAMAAAAATALGFVGLRGPLPLASGPEPAADNAQQQQEQQPGGTAADGPASRDVDMSAASHDTPGEAVLDKAEASLTTVLGNLGALLKDRDVQVAQDVAIALGRIAHGDNDEGRLGLTAKSLLGVAGTKSESLMFAVGEALCLVFGGVPVHADDILCGPFTTLADHVNKLEESSDHKLHSTANGDSAAAPARMDVDGTEGLPSTGQNSAPVHHRDRPDSNGGNISIAATMPSHSAVQQQILDEILQQVTHSRPEVRSAGCVWLTSLTSFTGQHTAVVARLGEVQEAFSGLLGDSEELTQELASRGLCRVYHLGDAPAQQALLDSLMGTLQGGPRKRRAVKVTGETRVFEEGQLGETPGGTGLTTYRELCALATELGQPDLLYRFMDLANHASTMHSSRGAAFGLASIAKLAGDQLQPHIAALIPKLYRYQHDPNPRVREAMTHIWQALIPDERPAIDKHFSAIAAELLRELGGRLWRVREACCLALADLLQGRRWPDLKEHFEATWTMALRALDDIKESVRVAAETLARTLRGLALRLADGSQTPPGEAAAAIGCTLPLLLTRGIPSGVAVVQGLSLDTLAKMVKLARPESVQPHLAELTAALLESLSGMEDARLNYIEQHAARVGLDAERLESLRVSASRASPLADTLDLCARYTTPASLPQLVPRLSQLVARGVGLNTRVGTARFLGQLTTRVGSDMRPHTGTLIKALTSAAKAERSAAVRRAYAAACAQLAAHAPEARAAKLASTIVELCSDGSLESRQLAGLLARELLRQAREVYNGHAAAIAPQAFVSRFDADKDVAALWAEVWEEGTTSHSAAVRLYLQELVQLVLQGLRAASWQVKQASARAAADIAATGADTLPEHAASIAHALLAEVPGRLWDGKAAVLEALAALCKVCPQQFQQAQGGSQGEGGVLGDQAVQALYTAAGRQNAAFRKAALSALDTVLQALQADFLDSVADLLLEGCRHASHAEASASQTEGEEQVAAPESKPPPALESVSCLSAAWSTAQPETRQRQGSVVAQALAACLLPGVPWNTRCAALAACTKFIHSLTIKLPQQDNSTAVASSELSWIQNLAPGVLLALEEAKISQVRLAALDTLDAMLSATKGGQAFSGEDQGTITAALLHMVKVERNVMARTRAQDLQKGMQSQ